MSDEDTREERSIFSDSVEGCVKQLANSRKVLEKEEHTRKMLEKQEHTTKEEVNPGQEGKFPYDSRCYRWHYSYNLGNNRRAEGEFIIPVIAQKAILLIYFIHLDVKIH